MTTAEAKREDILGVRLYSSERELIEQRAKDDGRTASALVRHIVLSHLQETKERAPAQQDGALAVSGGSR
jgi:mobilization protein NikA